MKITTDEFLQRLKIEEVLEKYNVVANGSYGQIATDIAKIFLQPDVARILPSFMRASAETKEGKTARMNGGKILLGGVHEGTAQEVLMREVAVLIRALGQNRWRGLFLGNKIATVKRG